MHTTTIRFVSWAAVSSAPQAEKISLEDQLKTNREHVERHGGIIVEELVVPGKSRNIVLFEDAARTISAYARLKELIDARAFDWLIFLDHTRLGRQQSLIEAIRALCRLAGIGLYETENPPASLDKPEQGYDEQLIGAIKAVGASQEVSKLKQRHTMGIVGRVENGKLPGGAPFGYVTQYDKDGNVSVAVKEPDATVVQLIFKWYLDGAGAQQIAAMLNEHGHQPPLGGTWAKGSVTHIIKRVWRYAGYSEVNKGSRTGRPYVRAKGEWEPLISEEAARSVERERKARRANRKLPTTPYLLSGLVYCLDCGYQRAITSRQDKRTTADKRHTDFRCRQHSNGYISYRKVMTAVRAAIEHVMATPVDELLANNNSDPAEPVLMLIAAEESATERITAALHRVDDAFAAGVLDMERYMRQVNLLAAQLNDAKARLVELRVQLEQARELGNRHERIEDLKRRGLAMLDSDDTVKANTWLRRRLRVYVSGNEVHHVELL